MFVFLIFTNNFSVIEQITAEYGRCLTQTPIKMETLMVESKQKMTKHEKVKALNIFERFSYFNSTCISIAPK